MLVKAAELLCLCTTSMNLSLTMIGITAFVESVDESVTRSTIGTAASAGSVRANDPYTCNCLQRLLTTWKDRTIGIIAYVGNVGKVVIKSINGTAVSVRSVGMLSLFTVPTIYYMIGIAVSVESVVANEPHTWKNGTIGMAVSAGNVNKFVTGSTFLEIGREQPYVLRNGSVVNANQSKAGRIINGLMSIIMMGLHNGLYMCVVMGAAGIRISHGNLI